MALAKDKLESLLKEAFSDAEIIIQDLAGDGDHYSVTVKSAGFKGKNRVEQHKMVYDALKGAMAAELHALAIKTELL
jgi:stress-induced morphogen